MSAHSASHRGGWLSALVAQVSDYVFEEVEETVEPQPAPLQPQPVVAVVAAAPRSGASTVARLLAAEMATRANGCAMVVGTGAPRRTAPPSRAAIRLATSLTGIGAVTPFGRLCSLSPHRDRDGAHLPAGIAEAARYLAPVVLDVAADGSAAGIGAVADRIVVVAGADSEPALLDAVAEVIGVDAIKVANRVADPLEWAARADVVLADSRIAARAAVLGTRALGSLGSGIADLADRLEVSR